MENQMHCIKCGNLLEDGQDFCPKCGTPRDDKEKVCCSKCGAEIKEGHDFCPKCGQRVSEESAANVTETPAAKPKSKKRIIAVCAVIAVAVVCAVAFLLLRNSAPKGPDFFRLYDENCNMLWSEVGGDGSYLMIDTNPFDVEDKGIAYPLAYSAVKNVNAALGLPESFMNDIEHTGGADGKQSQIFENLGVSVSWKYNPDIGLEITYKLMDPDTAPTKRQRSFTEMEYQEKLLKEYIAQTHDALMEDYGLDITYADSTLHIVYTEQEEHEENYGLVGKFTHVLTYEIKTGNSTASIGYTCLEEVYQKNKLTISSKNGLKGTITSKPFDVNTPINVESFEGGLMGIPAQQNRIESYAERIVMNMLNSYNKAIVEPLNSPF